IRSMWDDDLGHQMSGVLYEARYLLEDVKQRTTIRSAVLERIVKGFNQHRIPMASQPMRIVNEAIAGEPSNTDTRLFGSIGKAANE
ncbi:MAG: hypothetical protein KTR35_05980, partial [Gammaproteobacteria bacterium]|nr:hypothetical protein [Gammaproteobacteria bacterium]